MPHYSEVFMEKVIWFICGMMLGGSAAFLMFCLTVSAKDDGLPENRPDAVEKNDISE